MMLERLTRASLVLTSVLAACGGPTEPEAPATETTELSEEALMCRPRAAALDARRSLFITDTAVLEGADFSLQRTLAQLASQSGNPNITALSLFRQLWDTQNPGPGLGQGPHCDDELTAGGASLNGFPLRCGRAEGRQADAALDADGITPEQYLAAYKPVSLVNRFDLAPPSGEHCGEYRIVYAKDPTVGPGRNLIIFEAVLPNPRPGCGLAACRPVQELWASMTDLPSATTRATRLAQLYYSGYRGFAPVIHHRHFALGGSGSYGSAGRTGQIRTNQFMQAPWVLREYQLQHRPGSRRSPADLDFVPVELKTNAQGFLFDGAIATSTSPYAALAAAHQADFVGHVASLAGATLGDISMGVAPEFNAGEAEAGSTNNQNRYTFHFAQDGGDSAFRTAIHDRLTALDSALTPADIVARAQTQSCAGCHDLSNNASLGGGLTWPATRRFVHTDERSTEAGPDGARYPISVALSDTFLPARLEIMTNYLANSDCTHCGRVRFRNTRSNTEEAAAQAGTRLSRGNPVH